ncbi:MAG: lysylphosphatidylglycerol synthase domain-containing protein, partial [Acidimicrobiales bacterium]
MSAPIEPAPAPSPATRLVGTALVVVAAGCAVAVLASQWSHVQDKLEQLSFAGLTLAAVATAASMGASFWAWRTTLASLGASVAARPAARIFFLGQLGKYVPGSVFAIVGQMELGRRHGVRRERMAAAGLLVLAISLAVALALGLLAVPALADTGEGGYALLVLLIVPLAVVLHPRVLGPLLRWGFRRLGRPPLDRVLAGRDIVEVALLS